MLSGITAVFLLSIFLNCESRIIAYNKLYCLRISGCKNGRKCLEIFAYWYVRFCLMLAVSILVYFCLKETPILSGLCILLAAVLYIHNNIILKSINSFDLSRFVFGGRYLPLSVRQGMTLPYSSIPVVLVIACLNIFVAQELFTLLSALLFTTLNVFPVILRSIKVS